jgi:hypothetical protein
MDQPSQSYGSAGANSECIRERVDPNMKGKADANSRLLAFIRGFKNL